MNGILLADVKSNNVHGKSSGHYIPLSKNYLEIFKGERLFIAGGPIYSKYIDNEHFYELPCDSIVGRHIIINKFNVLRNCRFLFSMTDNSDIIILQHSGISTALIGIALFAKRKNNIYVIQYDTDSVSSFAKRIIYRFAKNKIKGIICPNKTIGNAFGLPYCEITDYIFTSDKVFNVHDFNLRKYDFSIVGTLHKDKGVIEVAKSFIGKSSSLLIAGKASEEDADELRKIATASDNIILRLGFVSDEDYSQYLKDSRYSILNYSGVYFERSSGVVLDTIFSGVPVVGSRCPALQFIEDEGIGCLYDDLNSFDFESLLSMDKHSEYMRRINNYLLTQKKYVSKLKKFIGDI